MQELTLSDACGAPLLRFARAYGFRNIQTVVRQIRGGRCAYDYVEVMACPAGCLNGGGQLKPPSGTTPAQLVEQLELLYYRQQLAQQQCGAGGTGGGSSCGGGGGGGARDGAALSRGQQQQQRFKVSPSVIQVLQDGRELAAAAAAAAAGHVQGLALAPDCIDARSLAAVYERVLGGSGPGSPAAAGLLHTQYHKREKTVTSTLSDW
jgi:DNA-binding transcriptional LysR family regulator